MLWLRALGEAAVLRMLQQKKGSVSSCASRTFTTLIANR